MGLQELAENWKDGRRQCSRDAYDLLGVKLLLNTVVHRVLIKEEQGMKRVIGVQLASGEKIIAAREVILSVGAYRTPQLLMLSGIGNLEDLAMRSIPVIIDNPDVGKNFHDHLSFCQWWKIRDPSSAIPLTLWDNPTYSKGVPYDWYVYQQISPDALKAGLNKDDTMHDNHVLLQPGRCHTETMIVYAPARSDLAGGNLLSDGSVITSIVVGMTPTSRGHITLASADPTASPVIDPSCYSTEVDRCTMREGIRQVMCVLLETSAGKEIVDREIHELDPQIIG